MNNQIFLFFYNLAHQSQVFDKVVIFFALYFPYVVVISAAVFLLFYYKKLKEFFLVFFSGVLAYIFSYILKYLFHTLRPFDVFPQVYSLIPENGFAFPSSHATFFMALAVAIFFYHKKAGYVFMLFALLIGIARITAGVHFPIDILGGFVLGGLIAYLVAR